MAGFAERHSIPVVTTYKAKGVLPEDHALSLGAAGLSPRGGRHSPRVPGEAAISSCSRATTPSRCDRAGENPWPADTRVIDLSAVPNTHYMHQAELCFIGDVGAGIAALDNGARNSLAPGPTERRRRPARHSRTPSRRSPTGARASSSTPRAGCSPATRWRRWTRAPIASCSPRCGSATRRERSCSRRGSAPWAAGCPWPWATSWCNPIAAVVAFTGDAGLEMVLGELATLRDLGLPTRRRRLRGRVPRAHRAQAAKHGLRQRGRRLRSDRTSRPSPARSA